MKLLYTHPNRILVENARNIVENAGFNVKLQNEFAAGAMGELAPISAWLELWIVHDRQHDAAKALLQSAFEAEDGAEWRCPRCGENNSPAFEYCWQCQSNRPE
ncbi:MAG: DUF2007 domain-containing protein [Cellvibrionaceae bacterium]